MGDPITSIGFYCLKKGLTELPALPGPFLNPPRGVAQRMADAGVILRDGFGWTHGDQRRIWKAGPNWGRFREWWLKHE
jgi:hypothetical protein